MKSVVLVLAALVLAGCHEDPDAVETVPPGKPGAPPGTKPLSMPSSPPSFSVRSPLGPGSDLAPVAPPTPGASTGHPAPYGGPAPREQLLPALAKADETVKGSYKGPQGEAVEIEGVCNVTEDSVSCWKPDGSPHKELVKMVKDSIARQDLYGQRTIFAIALGKKNRLVVFKLTNPKPPKAANVNVLAVGTTRRIAGYANVIMPPYPSEHGDVTLQAMVVTEEPSLQTTQARLSVSGSVDESVFLEPKVGARATFGRNTYTITDIRKGSTMPPSMGPAWTVTLKESVHGTMILPSLLPLDAGSKFIQFVDTEGSPVPDEVVRQQMKVRDEKFFHTGHPVPLPSNFRSSIAPNHPMGSVMDQVLFVDPAKVHMFQLSGVSLKQVDLTGIPMDPKR